jgi:hypothetical protein
MEEVPSITAGARRNEDIALDLMKFVAMTTCSNSTASASRQSQKSKRTQLKPSAGQSQGQT